MGLPANSRQSSMWATVVDPPEYSSREGEVRIDRREGVRKDSVR